MIEIKSISFSRPTQRIFDNFSATISPNSATLLTGANGCGKSTLLNLIGGVLTPDSGLITINGSDVSTLTAREQSEVRSIAPQRRIFDLAFTVNQLLSIIPVARRATHHSEVFDALEIAEIAELKVTELSLGQQQRASLALALIQEASFYLLDEPFSAQDSLHQERALELILALAKARGILVVAHNSESFAARFGRVLPIRTVVR
jgi:ABC-type cobalamin/Fe3+-siderophores transport system ATPase subunit